MEQLNHPASIGVILRNLSRVFDSRPIWAQINITPRCNLRCSYCTEFDNSRDHVPYEPLVGRIEHCRTLGALHVDLIGGEPLLHPDIARLMRAVTSRGMSTGMTTNGFLLTEQRLDELVDAGLGRVQISVDAVRPRPGIPKTLKTLRSRIEMVARRPLWLWVNAVLSEETFEDVREIAALCFEVGATISFSVLHERGRLVRFRDPQPVLETLRWLRDRKREGRRVATSYFLMDYYEHALRGDPPRWTCRGGNKAFYVSPEGRFHACFHRPSTREFSLVTPAEVAAGRRPKGCEDYCGVDCMLQTSLPYSNLPRVAGILGAEKLRSLGGLFARKTHTALSG